MSDAEQQAALVRLILERNEAKKHKALLESELGSAGRAFSEIGKALSLIDAPDMITLSVPDHALKEIDKAPEICSLGRVREMLIELREVRERVMNLDRRAKASGIVD